MIQEKSLEQVINRLETIENEVQSIKASLAPQATESFHFDFVIEVDGREVWVGKDLPRKYPEILHQHPTSEIAISWRTSPSIVLI